VLTVLILVSAAAWTGLRLANSAASGFGRPGRVEQAVTYLAARLEDTDLIVVNPPNDAVAWFYARQKRISPDHFKRELPFFRAYVLVDEKYGQTFDSVMRERGPDPLFFDRSRARVIYEKDRLAVFEIIPNEELIRSEYNLSGR
jgi:hypothetical protein